jgi:hypothetical protein
MLIGNSCVRQNVGLALFVASLQQQDNPIELNSWHMNTWEETMILFDGAIVAKKQ